MLPGGGGRLDFRTCGPPPSPLPRRLLAATAGLGLALSLTACTIGEVDDGADTATDAAAATSESSTIEASPSKPSSTEAPGPDDDAAPDVPMDQLVLNNEDAPQLGLAPVSPEEISGGIDTLSGIAEGMRVEPEQCAEINQDAVMSPDDPGALAIQSGLSGQTPVSVAVTTEADGVPGRAAQIEACPTMTITLPFGDQEVTADSTNTMLPFEAPEGVENFAAFTQETSMTVADTPLATGNVMLTGTVRGIGISVTAIGAEGPVPDEARDAALDAFVAQAEKIRAA